MQKDSAVTFVLVLGAVIALGPLSIDMYLPALPAIAAEFAAPASSVQLSLSACILGLALGQLVVGPLSDSLGRRPPLLAGLAVYVATSLLCALAPSVGVLTACRLLQGLAGSAGLVISTAVVRDRHAGAAAAKLFSRLMLVMGLAPILAPTLGGQLLALVSWHGIFVVQAAFGALLILVVSLALPETHPPERRVGLGLAALAGAVRALLADRGFLGHAATAGLAFAAMFAYIAGSPFVLQKIFGMTPAQFAMVFGANAFGLIATSQINGRLVERLGPRRLSLMGLALLAAAAAGVLVAVALHAGLVPLLGCLFLAIAAQGLVAPNTAALALAQHGRIAGSAAALLGALRFVIGAIAAPLVGVAGETSALPMALVMAFAAAGALGVGLRLRRAHN